MNITTGELFNFTLYGYSGEAVHRDWANTGGYHPGMSDF